MLSKIEVGKTYRNKDNKEKRIVNFIGNKYVLFTADNGAEAPCTLNTCLSCWEEIPGEMWVNVYKSGWVSGVHPSKTAAINNYDKNTGVKTYRLVKE